MTMIRAGFSQLMATGAHALFLEWTQTKQRDEEYTKFFNVENSLKPFEDDVQFAAFGAMPEKTENDSVMYTDGVQGGTKRYIHLTYALGCRTSWELYEDDQYGVIKQIPKALARSAQFTKEMVAANIFNLGFTTVTTTDGLSLFNNAHTLLGGPGATNAAPGLTNVISTAGTYPNRPATDADFSFTALQLMANHFERMIDSQGLPIQIKPKVVVIPPELKFIAKEILGSPNKPYTSDNEINSLLGEDLSFTVGHYFTSQSAWFVLADKSDHYLKFFNRSPLKDYYDDDFDTGAMKTITKMRISAGASNWIGTWGSNGP